MIEIILLVFLCAYILLQLLVLAGYASERPKFPKLTNTPNIAILIPARNEEESIEACLNSILAINYPKECTEVWVGNDHSTDKTAEIVRGFSKQYPTIQLFEISDNLGSARAKGNVLAQLMKTSTAPYIFVTDADIIVSKDWIIHLLPALMQPKMGIVSGATLVEGKTLFEKWQGIEWSLGNGYIIGLDQLGLKSTAVGNNMCFTREAYEVTGGYELMPFSVTEDFQLFQAIKQNGYETLNLIEPESLNISQAQTKMKSLLHQRKRWMIGAQDLPWYWIFIFGLQAIFYPCLFWLLIVHSDLALDIWLIKVLLQSFYLVLIHIRLKRPMHWLSFVMFEPYSLAMQLMMIWFYIMPVSMVWKDRKY